MGNRNSSRKNSSARKTYRQAPDQKSLARKEMGRDLREKFLIICEGTTEYNYFDAFPVQPRAKVYPINAQGGGPEGFLNKAIEEADKADYDQIWCVFDVDVFKKDQKRFEEILATADEKTIKIAYSNEDFELWFLLHFDSSYQDSKRRKRETKNRKNADFLAEFMGEYQKGNSSMYDDLRELQSKAIKNSIDLLGSYRKDDPLKNNPSTTVHQLVEQLNRFLHDRAY